MIKHEFEPHYVPCNEMTMIMIFFCLVLRMGLTCFAVWSCGFVLEHLTISRFRAGNSCSISLPKSGFLELFEGNKLVNKVKDSVQFCNQFLLGHCFFILIHEG